MPFALISRRFLVLALGLVLAGCSSSAPTEGPGPAASPTGVVAVPPAAVPASPDASPPSPSPPAFASPPAAAAKGAPLRMDRFVAAVRSRLPQVAMDRRDEEVAEIGARTCASLAAGKRTRTVLGEIRGFGVADRDAGTLLDLAEDTACRT